MLTRKHHFPRLAKPSLVLAVVAVALAASGSARAQTTPAPVLPKIRVTGPLESLKTERLSSGSFQFQFSDGRAFRVQMTPQLAHSVTNQGEVSATTCGLKPVPMTKCKVKEDVLLFEIKVVWSAHPDKSKIGKTVEAGGSTATSTVILAWNDRGRASKLPQAIQTKVKAMVPPQFRCESWDWLSAKNGEVYMPEWSAEDMKQNRETGQSENRSIGSYRDVRFDFDGQGMTLKSFGRQHGQIGFLMMLGGAETTAITQVNAGGEVCQAALQIANPMQPFLKIYYDQLLPKHSEANVRPWTVVELTTAARIKNNSTYIDLAGSQLSDEMKFLNALNFITSQGKTENNEQITEYSFRELN